MSSAYQIYRSTTIGSTLDDTLRELLHRQIITPRIVHYILNVFDQIITQKLSYQSVKGKKESSIIFKGHLLSYRSCDQVWTLVFDSLRLTSNIDPSWEINFNQSTNKIKIISCPNTNLTPSNFEQSTENEDQLNNKSQTHKKFKSS